MVRLILSTGLDAYSPKNNDYPFNVVTPHQDKIRLISATDDVKCTVRTVITQRLGANGIVREGNFRSVIEYIQP